MFAVHPAMSVCAVLLASAAAVVAVPAAAQTVGTTTAPPAEPVSPIPGPTEALTNDEIVVTARKRAESLLDVPVAISAVSSADLNRYAATDLGKIGQLIPQVIIAKTGGGGAGASFAIRGIGSSALDAGIDQTVTVNLDGLQVSRGRITTQSFFDVEQVEVLKGPQALFFGKNSPGGVISIRTAGPTETFQGYAKAGYEFEADERYFEGAVSGPLSKDLGFRVAVRGSELEGWMRNVAGPFVLPSDPGFIRPGAARPRDPGTGELLGRITLAYDPDGPFDATLKVFGSKQTDNGETANSEYKCNGPVQTFDVGSNSVVTDPYADCKLDGRRSSSALPIGRAADYPGSRDGRPYGNYRSVLSSLTMNYDAGVVDFASVTGYYKYRNSSFDNFSFSAVGNVWGLNRDTSSAFTQEVRATTDFDGPINVLLGGFFESSDRDTLGNGALGSFGLDPVTGRYDNWQLLSFNTGKTYSAFGQVIWDIVPSLELAGGARFTRETKRVRVGNSYVHGIFAPLGFVLPEGQFLSGRFADNDVSPEATLTWKPTPNTTIYGAYKTGYKSGGFSNPSILSAGTVIDDLRFAPESAEGGELGAKANLLDGRLSLNLAVYRYTFKGLQLTSFDADTVTFSIRNAASARTTGVELDGSYRATEELRLRAAAGYNRARYLDFGGAPCYTSQSAAQGCVGGVQDLSGSQLVRAPDWSLTGGLTYDRPVSPGLMLGLSGDANYTSAYWLQENQNPNGRQSGFARLNASVRVYERDERWELALIGRNLTNKYYGVASQDKTLAISNDVAVAIGRPREIIVQGTVRF